MNNKKRFEEIRKHLESFLTPGHLRNEHPCRQRPDARRHLRDGGAVEGQDTQRPSKHSS